jgi:hypothetical protein
MIVTSVTIAKARIEYTQHACLNGDRCGFNVRLPPHISTSRLLVASTRLHGMMYWMKTPQKRPEEEGERYKLI